MPHGIPGRDRRLLLRAVAPLDPDASPLPPPRDRARRASGGPGGARTDHVVRVAGKNRYTPRAGFAVTGGRAVGLPWDAPEVSETVFGSRARVEIRVASCAQPTHARAFRRRARPSGRSGGPS